MENYYLFIFTSRIQEIKKATSRAQDCNHNIKTFIVKKTTTRQNLLTQDMGLFCNAALLEYKMTS